VYYGIKLRLSRDTDEKWNQPLDTELVSFPQGGRLENSPSSEKSEEFWLDTSEGGHFREIWVCLIAKSYYQYYCLALVSTNRVGGNESRRIELCVLHRQTIGADQHGVDFFEKCEDETLTLV
jgi:hypothetical protein